ARLQVVLVDGLERHFHLHLLAVVGELALELGLALGNEVHTEEEMEPRGLGVGGRPPRGEDARKARRNAPEELPAVHRSAAMLKDLIISSSRTRHRSFAPPRPGSRRRRARRAWNHTST